MMWKTPPLFIILFFAMLMVAHIAYAQCPSDGYPNPTNFCDIPTFVLYLASAVIKITVPIAVLMIIFVGFKFVAASARGQVKGIEEARKLLMWTLVGTAIIVGAAAIAYGFVNFVKTL